MKAVQSLPMPTEESDVDRLKELLVAIGRLCSLRDPMASACAEMELTKPQIHALYWLGLGPLTMGDLARHLQITEKTSTGVVDRLERDGWVLRQRSADDRRVVRVSVTRKGRTLAQKLDRLLTEQLTFFLGLLDGPSRKALFQVMDRLVGHLPDFLSATSLSK